jgi:hypothetical protein
MEGDLVKDWRPNWNNFYFLSAASCESPLEVVRR